MERKALDGVQTRAKKGKNRDEGKITEEGSLSGEETEAFEEEN